MSRLGTCTQRHPRIPEIGKRDAYHQRGEDEEFQRRSVENGTEGGAAVIEHHHLVDHGQLEVGIRIVERDAAVLGEQDDEERGHHQNQRGRRARRPVSAGQHDFE